MAKRNGISDPNQRVPTGEPVVGTVLTPTEARRIATQFPTVRLPTDTPLNLAFMAVFRARGLTAAMRALRDAYEASEDARGAAAAYLRACREFELEKKHFDAIPEYRKNEEQRIMHNLHNERQQIEHEHRMAQLRRSRELEEELAAHLKLTEERGDGRTKAEKLLRFWAKVRELRNLGESVNADIANDPTANPNDAQTLNDMIDEMIRELQDEFQANSATE